MLVSEGILLTLAFIPKKLPHFHSISLSMTFPNPPPENFTQGRLESDSPSVFLSVCTHAWLSVRVACGLGSDVTIRKIHFLPKPDLFLEIFSWATDSIACRFDTVTILTITPLASSGNLFLVTPQSFVHLQPKKNYLEKYDDAFVDNDESSSATMLFILDSSRSGHADGDSDRGNDNSGCTGHQGKLQTAGFHVLADTS